MLILDSAPENIIPNILWALCGLVVLMGGALVWVIKNKNQTPIVDPPSGEMSESKWILNITTIVRNEISELRAELKAMHEAAKEHADENFDEVHKARNSLLALHGKVDEAERNILEAVKNGH